MLPIHISEAVKKQVLHYIGATYDFRSKEADTALTKFITDPEKGLFKGPWIQVKRPFTQAPISSKAPFDIPVSFHPFSHQQKAWARLTTKDGNAPKHTVVTTGTGSGKTECFLYPVLDYAVRAKKAGKKGIKAIILYPMNALASDQERRFAKEIFKTKELKNAGIQVGLFTGRDVGESAASSGNKEMGPNHGISNQNALRDNPPDILLTNYKMLDFLLMRPKDAALWRFNEPGTLQYLILDELHTYDGAQGADVACLIRRLKERLNVVKGNLCVVGTSATIDEGAKTDRDLGRGIADQQESAGDVLRAFAGRLFEEDIEDAALIGEDRIPTDKLINFETLDESTLVFPEPAEAAPIDGETAAEYAFRQAALWGAPSDEAQAIADFKPLLDGEVAADLEAHSSLELICLELALGKWLMQHPIFARILQVTERAELEGMPLEFGQLVKLTLKESLQLGAEFTKRSAEEREAIFASFFALIAHAKELRSKRPFPLVSIQVQLWMRELRRLGRVVQEATRFRWLEEPVKESTALPAFQCSRCGESGWAALRKQDTVTSIQARGVDGFELETDAAKIYRASFERNGRRDHRLVYFSRYKQGIDDPPESDELQIQSPTDEYYIHPTSLIVRRGVGECPLSGAREIFRIKLNDRTQRSGTLQVGAQGCPHCGDRQGIFFIGARGAVLSSVAIDEMYGSPLNSDPKLLAFTDSVQDASHRAGFFSARTYHFTFRTALQHLIDDAGSAGLALDKAGIELLNFWSNAPQFGSHSLRDAIESLLPPDLREYGDYLAFRESDATTPAPDLRAAIETRLAWEAVSEFGVMQTHGRTLERMGSAALGWDDKIITSTVEALKNALPGVAESLEVVTKEQLRLWILGLLHRFRERGVLDHPFMNIYIERDWWGKTARGYTPPEREIFPPGSRYVPGFLCTTAKRKAAYHHITAASRNSSKQPWTIKWARRALQQPACDEVLFLDLTNRLLEAATESGLFRKVKQDNAATYYTICATAARLYSECELLRCSSTDKYIVKPTIEAELWRGANSMEYYGDHGAYQSDNFTPRQEYYRARYRKGALRRVVAEEHTGLLETKHREKLEGDFIGGKHRDDPNLLTCTSTLEMGIDIGDLSSTMLCSIPPSTANYLQRIGRAGRQTGSSFIISVVNQRPHDLFFFARPQELLKGKIDTPGCWLDASAVLLRQYFGFCLDSATAAGVLTDFPAGAKSLYEDEQKSDGIFRSLMKWVEANETNLQARFLDRFSLGSSKDVSHSTRERFIEASQTIMISNRVHEALKSFAAEFKSISDGIEAISKRLTENQLADDDKLELERERSVLKGRLGAYQRVGSYELLCDHGLLPNYAFPDRGVRFYGSVYNQLQRKLDTSVELVRSASASLRELAPLNSFYTHRREFQIQRIAVGNAQQSLIREFGVCGHCGYFSEEKTNQSCPQCARSGSRGPGDHGNRRFFIEFPRSYALSSMEFYESFSGDKAEERERQYYRLVSSFDQTVESPSGAVGEDSLPFGIEYREQLILREINTGFYDSELGDHFGPDQEASLEAFMVCKACGIVRVPGTSRGEIRHPRSCSARKEAEKLEKQGKDTDKCYEYVPVNLYRELSSEAVRLLVPFSSLEELDTLSACLELGLRRKFRGSPNHLVIRHQRLPDSEGDLYKNFLVLMDGVPGGTGYLKSLYQQSSSAGIPGEGLVEVLELALQALETCSCRRPPQSEDEEDTDGCYRCIRSYYTQYNSENISRALGVRLLKTLLEAAKGRVVRADITSLSSNSLFESELEQRFITELRHFASENEGSIKPTMVGGRRGFRLEIADQIWDIELQRTLDEKDGVMTATRPDFIFWPQDTKQKPVAVYTDGKEFHLSGADDSNKLADDFKKRRAVLESKGFWIWSLCWDDLVDSNPEATFAFSRKFDGRLSFLAKGLSPHARNVTSAANRNPFEQFCAFLTFPNERLWRAITNELSKVYLDNIDLQKVAAAESFKNAFWKWRNGFDFEQESAVEQTDFCYSTAINLFGDLLIFKNLEGIDSADNESLRMALRLPAENHIVKEASFVGRWRASLATINLFQFQPEFSFWACTEIELATAPDPYSFFAADKKISAEWQHAINQALISLKPSLELLALKHFPVPSVAVFDAAIHREAEAELVWGTDSSARVAVLAGEQLELKELWESNGYVTLTKDEFIKLIEDEREDKIKDLIGE